MQKFYKSIALIFLFGPLAFIADAQMVINEYSASNLTQFQDNYSKYEDWVELYNPTSSTVSLIGYYLSDDTLNNTKWQFPSTATIAANGFLRVWLSGRNVSSGNTHHTNFKVTQTKNNPEQLVFSGPGGNIIDFVVLNQKTQLNHSIGRKPNGSATWNIFTTPTPNASNTTTGYTKYADKPVASHNAGYYSSPISVTLTTTEPNSMIYYTLNGNLPTGSSSIYSVPLTILTTTVVKAVTVSATSGVLPSFVEYETYFLGADTHSVVVLSIAATQLNTLANGNSSLQPYGSFEYFDKNRVRVASTYGEYNEHGQDSWALSHRSLDFVSRDEMGYNHSIEEKIFSRSNRQNFQRVILRASGDDNYPADGNSANAGSCHMRDAYIQSLVEIDGLHLDVRRSEKCVIYLNGQYWGVYDIREKVHDHDMTEYYYGQDKYHLYMIMRWGSVWAEYGSTTAFNDWNPIKNFVLSNNMTVPANYQWVTDRIDPLSLIDYICVNMFTVCTDWLNWNLSWWRGTDSTAVNYDNKWRWMLWDNDATFDFYINYTGLPSTQPNADPCDPEGLEFNGSDLDDHMAMHNKLRTNPEYEQLYIARQHDLWNTTFSCDNMIPKFDSIRAIIQPEMARQATRWSGSYTQWWNNTNVMRNFIIARCDSIKQGWIDCYSLTGPHDIVLNADPVNAGSIKINSLTIDTFPWYATYFGNMDTKLEAVADTLFTFTNWTSNSQTFNPNATTDAVTIDLNANDSIVAHFIFGVSVEEAEGSGLSLNAYPTVFTDNITVEFNLPVASKVSLKLYSITTSNVSGIASQEKMMQPGKYTVTLDVKDANLAAAIYMLELTAGNEKKTIKLVGRK